MNSYTIDLIKPSTRVESQNNELKRVADILSYPLIIRSSSHSDAIKIINDPDELKDYLCVDES